MSLLSPGCHSKKKNTKKEVQKSSQMNRQVQDCVLGAHLPGPSSRTAFALDGMLKCPLRCGHALQTYSLDQPGALFQPIYPQREKDENGDFLEDWGKMGSSLMQGKLKSPRNEVT